MLDRSKLIRRGTALLLGALACSSITDPPLDPRAVPLQPTPVYARWWSMVESCSGLQGSLSEVSWYEVPGSETVEYPGADAAAYWSAASDRIVLAGKVTDSGVVVRHEMLHALLRDVRGHPRDYFLERCGGVVSCTSSCVTDAGPAPSIDVTTERVTSNVLKLFVSIVPEAPSRSVDGGAFTVIVTATNPNSHAIVITPSQNALNRSFFFTLFRNSGGSIGGSVEVLDSSMIYFAAGETKRQYFDFLIGAYLGGHTVTSDTYRLYAGYETRGVAFEGVAIGP
jgi:hypothetical protein